MKELREKLHKAIDKYGLDYEKLIEIDNELHDEVIRQQKRSIAKKMKIGDRVKVVYQKERNTNGIPFKVGEVVAITKKIIVVQFKNYRESFMKNEILAKGWIDVYKRIEKQWVKIDREDLM